MFSFLVKGIRAFSDSCSGSERTETGRCCKRVKKSRAPNLIRRATMAIFSCEHEVTNNLCSSDQTIGKASGDRWAVILAGGDGTRLQSLTRSISGDDRPKQFCPIIGGRTFLDPTNRRVRLSVAPEQKLTVLTRTHELFYGSLL